MDNLKKQDKKFYHKRILALVLLIATLLLPYFLHDYIHSPESVVVCPFRAITGIPCPSCGFTRAFSSIAHGEIGAAIRYHPLSPILFLITVILFVVVIVEIKTGKSILTNPLKKREDIYKIFLLVIVFQLVRTAAFFMNGDGWHRFLHDNVVGKLVSLVRVIF